LVFLLRSHLPDTRYVFKPFALSAACAML
jgi:hypothetical protein